MWCANPLLVSSSDDWWSAPDLTISFPGIEDFFCEPYFCWYSLPTQAGLQAAFNLLEETIEDEGPFDGVIAFSQGAAVVSSYILQSLKESPARSPFKFAIFFSAAMPFDLDSLPFTFNKDEGRFNWADTNELIDDEATLQTIPEPGALDYSGKFETTTRFLRRYPKGDQPRIHIPTVHIAGLDDEYWYPQSLGVRDMCDALNRHFLEHRGGHEVPKDRSMTTKMVQVIQHMLQAALVG
jgi:pimeloyl-ACP methyl ester carboxylesterase